jgi:hypothetical protein
VKFDIFSLSFLRLYKIVIDATYVTCKTIRDFFPKISSEFIESYYWFMSHNIKKCVPITAITTTTTIPAAVPTVNTSTMRQPSLPMPEERRTIVRHRSRSRSQSKSQSRRRCSPEKNRSRSKSRGRSPVRARVSKELHSQKELHSSFSPKARSRSRSPILTTWPPLVRRSSSGSSTPQRLAHISPLRTYNDDDDDLHDKRRDSRTKSHRDD